jgi:hypothetical protein
MGRWSWECFSYRRDGEVDGKVVFEGKLGMGESEEGWGRVLSGSGFVGVRTL